MSIASKILRNVAVIGSHTICRPWFDKEDRAWIRQQAEEERTEELVDKLERRASPPKTYRR